MWKPEYAARRKQRAAEDPEYRAKRNEQGNGIDREKKAEYMREYRLQNLDKWKRTPEQQAAINERRRDRYAADAEYREQAKRSARARDPRARRVGRLQSQYGITDADYAELLRRQDGACAICRRPHPKGKHLHVDHCHDTGAVRGLLCSACNTGIGHFEDNTNRLERAIEYIREARAMGSVVPIK